MILSSFHARRKVVMLLSEDESIGASIPQHLFLIRNTCKQCQQSADFTVLITRLGAQGCPARKVPLCKSHWEQAMKENPTKRPYPPKVAKLLPFPTSDSERAGYQ
jgi:hypothetical protein